MRAYLPVLFACIACGGGVSPTTPQELELERFSPPQPTSHDILLGSRGDVVVMARRFSLDAGATWQALDPRLGQPTRVAIVGSTVALYADGLVRWNLTTDMISQVAGAPGYVTDRTWRVDPVTSRFIAYDAIENSIAVETASGWQTGKLPQPSSTEVRPYIRDIESNGNVLLATSVWGMHRSLDGGASWELVTATFPGGGRDLLVLADKRFVLVGGMTTYVFDAQGAAAGTQPSLVVMTENPTVCEDGTIVAGNKLTRNLGASWESLVATSDLAMTIARSACGGNGRYWMLAISDAWGYRLVRFDAVGTPGVVAGNWDATGDQQWASGGPPIVRTADGTFLVAGLALAPGSSIWTLQELPARAWASGATLFGVAKQKFYTSHDGGVTWTATAATGLGATEPEAFARSKDGTLYVSQFTGGSKEGLDTWQANVWKSADQGVTWTMAYDAKATRPTGGDKIEGEVHRFVGITDSGDWIATDAVSKDSGITWQKTTVLGDRGLAHLTHGGTLVTGGADEKLWRVYDDGGLGELRATYQLVVDGEPVPAQQLRSVAFDEQGFAYVARGTPQVQIWKSNRPLD